MLNVKFNMKASKYGRTGFVSNICRNKVSYIVGTVSVVGFIWYCNLVLLL